jgi:hypothetical protein
MGARSHRQRFRGIRRRMLEVEDGIIVEDLVYSIAQLAWEFE